MMSGTASVTSGIGSVAGTPGLSGNTMTVELIGVANAQKITVTLSGLMDSSAQTLSDTPVSMNVLIGDTNGNKAVNSSDVSQTKQQSGLSVTSTNFRSDVNVSRNHYRSGHCSSEGQHGTRRAVEDEVRGQSHVRG